MVNTSLLDNIISGRIEPHIYAFKTGTIPDYLKVGDTYRPVNVRLEEWKKYFPNLVPQYRHKAIVNDGRIFRDYSVHHFLENNRDGKRLVRGLFPLAYYSNEFFKNISVSDIDNDP